MKKHVALLATLFIITVWLSGCILRTTPNTDTPVIIKVGATQDFSTYGMFNGSYAWYKNDTLIDGATSSSYTYEALDEDSGVNTIKVQTTGRFNNEAITREWTVEVVDNLPPTADAGPDQFFDFGNVVQLDGSGSTDPEDQTLTYLWEIVARPDGSEAELDDPYAVAPSFTPDVEGAYTIRLIVNDGESNSAADAVVIYAYSDFVPPIAEAGDNQTILLGSTVPLSGSESSDFEGHDLTYHWTIDSGPTGNTATLDDSTSMTPIFTPDKKGIYVISLVVNDGRFDSGTDWVIIIVYNHAPVARAGDDITIAELGGTAQLDGRESSDPDGTGLTYSWSITSRPDDSTAMLSDEAIANPTFTPDKKGAYVMTLTVSDGDLIAEDTVLVTSSNHVPVAEAGDNITIPFTQIAQLDGSGSDPDGDVLTYAWTIVSAPDGSSAELSDATVADPTFMPDVKGTYEFSLIVTDTDSISSAPDTVTVTTTNHAPVANAGSDINIFNSHAAQLSGNGTDTDNDTLTYSWTIDSAPTGSTAELSDATIADPTFTPDKKGDYTLSLVVNDGEADSVADTVQIHASNNPPVSEAGPDQTVHYAGRAVQLDGSGSSDLDGDTMTYSWSIESAPEGSSAALSNAAIVNPTITLDKPGSYVISLVVSDNTGSTTDTVTLTTYQETIVENWDDGAFLPWYKSNNEGSWGTIDVDDETPYSGSYSFWAQGAWFGTNTLMISRDFTNTWLIQIDFMYRGYAANMAQLKTSIYLNGNHYQDIRGDSGNTWYLKSYSPNMVVTKVGFYFDSFWGTDGVFLDDITFTVWD